MKTKDVARLLRVQPPAINEAVFAGVLNCTKETVRGSARRFDEANFIALHAFFNMISIGVRKCEAGEISSKVFDTLNSAPEAESLTIHGESYILVLEFDKARKLFRGACDAKD